MTRAVRAAGWAAAGALALLCASPAAARPVALELVLALDASTSIDAEEYDLQREGLRLAFENSDVIDALKTLGEDGLAISVIQWSGNGQQRTAVGWTLIRGAADARAFAATVGGVPRMLSGVTDIGGAISYSLAAIQSGPYEGRRRVIDVSGDGTSDNPDVWMDRDRAVALGVTVNGLVVRGGEPARNLANVDVVDHYRQFVIGGDGAFLVTAADYRDFADAIRRKLVCEILGPTRPGAQSDDPLNRCSPLVLGDARSTWRR